MEQHKVTPRRSKHSRYQQRSSIRTSMGPSSMIMMTSGGARGSLNLGQGVAASSSKKSVDEMKTCSEKEKKQMQGLNVKLAERLERTRFLECENKHLRELLNNSKIEFNIEVIKRQYDEQLEELKALLEEKDNELAATKSRNESLEEEVEDLTQQLRHMQDMNDKLQSTVDGLHDEVARRIADSETCRRRTTELEKQLADWKERNAILDAQLKELRVQLQNETTQRLAEAARVQALEDEIAFLTDVHDAQVREYEAMLSKSKSLPSFSDSWKSEAGSLVAELSAEYESQLRALTITLETRHAQQMESLRAGSKPDMSRSTSSTETRRSGASSSDLMDKIRMYETQIANMKIRMGGLEGELLKSQNLLESERGEHLLEVTQLRAEMEGMMIELQDLMDAKLSLELEIAAYRKLIEGEENRMSIGGMMSSMGGFQSESEMALSAALSSKLTMSRVTNGSVSIVELDNDGKFIELSDNAAGLKGSTSMKNWTLTQTLDSGVSYTHKFTDGNVFISGKAVKIWGSKHGAGQGGVTSSSVSQWGAMTGPSTITLKDDKNKDSAVLTIKINV